MKKKLNIARNLKIEKNTCIKSENECKGEYFVIGVLVTYIKKCTLLETYVNLCNLFYFVSEKLKGNMFVKQRQVNMNNQYFLFSTVFAWDWNLLFFIWFLNTIDFSIKEMLIVYIWWNELSLINIRKRNCGIKVSCKRQFYQNAS